MRQVIGPGEVFKLETGTGRSRIVRLPLVVFKRPNYPFRSQGVSHADNVKKIPPATIVLPFAPVGVHQISPKHETRDFIVKTNGVVTYADGAWLGQSLFNLCGKLVFRQAVFQTILWRNAGEKA